MILDAFQIFRYEIPFRQPLRLTGRELGTRTGCIIALHERGGAVGYGEIAPLPGLHTESLEEAFVQLRGVVPLLLHKQLPHSLQELFALTSTLHSPLFPTVQTGVEMALCNLLAHHTNTPLSVLFAPTYHATVPLNALLSGSHETMERDARALLNDGYTTFKIKVGRLPIEREIETVQHIRTIVGNYATLRLDANRSWLLPTAIEFGMAIAKCSIAYIEEPLADTTLLPEFFRATGIPIALDESLAYGQQLPNTGEHVQALVLKPTVVGGIGRTMELVGLAREHGIQAVLSSAFETGVALSFYAGLAAIANTETTACGLDTYKYLAGDSLEQPFAATHGRVHVDTAWQQAQTLRTEVLQQYT